ncbi:MAG: plasmid pRiA4b ORF-3 family protein [Candidatus Aminicenantes bacterium]|nr:plasmid pRiA4b ORF-3 family protein [Candidatus Aminicenantes bacterium]
MKGMQFRITLLNIKPPIWRKIIVPESYSFWDLHVAIQDAFGWTDSHLHRFELSTRSSFQIGIPDPEGMDFTETKPGWEINLKDYVKKTGQKTRYVYDFGDNWEHEIEFEKETDVPTKKPICIDGKRACPPEDCGGPWGYSDLLEIVKNKKDKRYKEMKEWLGREFKPEEFNLADVEFDNPKTRLKMMDEMQ